MNSKALFAASLLALVAAPLAAPLAATLAGCGAADGDADADLGLADGTPAAASAQAAKKDGCTGGSFQIVLAGGRVVPATTGARIAAADLAAPFAVRGTYNEFVVEPSTFGVRDYALTGAPGAEDLTGGKRVVLYAAKTPDHRGLALSGDAVVGQSEGALEIARSGDGLTMKIQAKDCAAGGVFQMEVERADGTETRFTHLLGDGVFFFDNPNFRARAGDVIPYRDTTLTVSTRVNFASDASPRLVGRDSPQEATRVPTGCPNTLAKRAGGTELVDHCGGRSDWSVKSGGRLGGVLGEDAVEVAPAQPVCTHRCQSRSQTRGDATTLGFPSPVPASSRLSPR